MNREEIIERLSGIAEYGREVIVDLEVDGNYEAVEAWMIDVEALETAIDIISRV